MSAYGAFRSGWDAPSRIAGTAVMLANAEEILPGEPMYQPISFYPSITNGDGTQVGIGTSEHDVWQRYPGRCDLTFYQGDDVLIDLYIQDPSDSTPDMSTSWDWTAEIRVLHTYHSTLVNTFSVIDEYEPPAGEVPGQTKVTLFLPRTENVYVGKYRWDLFSESPLDVVGFPRPPDVPEPEPWPPTSQVRTWLYGVVTIIPRVTATDALPEPSAGEIVEPLYYPFTFVGPNGRVP